MTDPISKEQFLELLRRTNHEHPKEEDVQKLRAALEQAPSLIDYAGNLAIQAQQALLHNTSMSAGARALLEAGTKQLSQALGYSSASKLEQLLIEQINLCYLRLYVWEYLYHSQAGDSSRKPGQVKEWEGIISSAQKRYFRAIETLVRVRKLNLQIQINIATSGGQQINVADSNGV